MCICGVFQVGVRSRVVASSKVNTEILLAALLCLCLSVSKRWLQRYTDTHMHTIGSKQTLLFEVKSIYIIRLDIELSV